MFYLYAFHRRSFSVRYAGEIGGLALVQEGDKAEPLTEAMYVEQALYGNDGIQYAITDTPADSARVLNAYDNLVRSVAS